MRLRKHWTAKRQIVVYNNSMVKAFKIVGLIALLLALVIFLAIKLLLPKEYVVNAPILQSITGVGIDSVNNQKLQHQIALPPGFSINIYAKNLGSARALLLLPNGDLLASSAQEQKIYRILADKNNDGHGDSVTTVLSDLNDPFGLEYHKGMLYVGETDAIIRVPYDVQAGVADTKRLTRIIQRLPSAGHWTRTVKVGPDEKLYVSIGSSCNVCLEDDPRRATLMRYNLDGSNAEIFASGLRNTVGFAWHPLTGEIYGVDNGRDFLGDNFPPCELNKIVQGGFYGWPFFNGDNVKDPSFGLTKDPRIALAIKPVHGFAAHTAPLGITFLTALSTPKHYKNTALVTQHGSWNRSKKSGYQIVLLRWQANGSISEEPFATGFMVNEKVFGRPVDVVQSPDGSIFVSDDFTSSIYRITYQ